MSLLGDLGEVKIGDVLQVFSTSRKTGVLTVAAPGRQAVLHLQKAIAVSPSNEVAHYQLSVAYGRLGSTADQQKELAEFQRLQARKRARDAFADASRQVTKQELDPKAPPP